MKNKYPSHLSLKSRNSQNGCAKIRVTETAFINESVAL